MVVAQLREELVAAESARLKWCDRAKYERVTLEGKIASLEKKLSVLQEAKRGALAKK